MVSRDASFLTAITRDPPRDDLTIITKMAALKGMRGGEDNLGLWVVQRAGERGVDKNYY